MNDKPYVIYLDNRVEIAQADLTYSRATDQTTFTIPNTIFTNAGHEIHAYVSETGAAQFGCTAEVNVNGTTGELDRTGLELMYILVIGLVLTLLFRSYVIRRLQVVASELTLDHHLLFIDYL